MSIFALFNFKSKLATVTNSSIIQQVFEYARQLITLYAADHNISGIQKKQKVDTFVAQFVAEKCRSNNSIVNFIIAIIIKNIPVITQCIYNYLKSYVDGLTVIEERRNEQN